MIEIYCDLKNRTKINNLPLWCEKKIKSSNSKIKITYNITKINKNITIYFGDLVTRDKLELMPNLKWIHFASSGTNRSQLSIVKKRKIIVTNSPDGFVHSLTCLALAHIFSFSRGIHFANNLRNQNNLNRKSIDKYFEFIDDLRDTNVLIVGFGKVGKLIAKVINIMGAKVHALLKRNKLENTKNVKYYNSNQIQKVLNKMDFVINLLPLNKDTKHFFNIKYFRKMKKKSYFISLGRGQTVLESDLILALKKGYIHGAGLDVFENEPLPKNSKLYNFKNVVLTPHIGNINQKYWKYEIDLFLNNLNRFLNKKKLINTVKI